MSSRHHIFRKAKFSHVSFIVVIVLLNVLIAVVSESYRHANERGNEIFVRSCFDLISEFSSDKLISNIASANYKVRSNVYLNIQTEVLSKC